MKNKVQNKILGGTTMDNNQNKQPQKKTMVSRRRFIELIGYDCESCVKKMKVGKDMKLNPYYECSVFKEFYFVLDKEEKDKRDSVKGRNSGIAPCWAYGNDIREWYKLLRSQERDDKVRTIKEIQLLEEQIKADGLEDWLKIYKEEQRRGAKGGGGEKADRTNKTFGPARMKDNKWKPEFGKDWDFE